MLAASCRRDDLRTVTIRVPAMHNAAFTALEMNWAYLAFHVDPANLRNALLGVRDMNYRGVNLTIPHKILALDLVDEVDAHRADRHIHVVRIA